MNHIQTRDDSIFLTRLKEALEVLPHFSVTVARRTGEEGNQQLMAMKMSGDIICCKNLSSSTTVFDVRMAVESNRSLPLRVAWDGNIYPKESFVAYYGTITGSEKWDIACKLFPADHFRFLSLSGKELYDETVFVVDII